MMKKVKGVDGFQIKLVMALLMVLDHIDMVFTWLCHSV